MTSTGIIQVEKEEECWRIPEGAEPESSVRRKVKRMFRESLERKDDSVNDLGFKSLKPLHVSTSFFVLPPRELHWNILMSISLGTEVQTVPDL